MSQRESVSWVETPIGHYALMPLAEGRYLDGRYIDEHGYAWERTSEYLEPDEARSLISSGADWTVEWCGHSEPPPDTPGTLLAEVVPSRRAERLLRRKTVPTVFVAEQWHRDGRSLVLFVEGPPAGRSVTYLDDRFI